MSDSESPARVVDDLLPKRGGPGRNRGSATPSSSRSPSPRSSSAAPRSGAFCASPAGGWATSFAKPGYNKRLRRLAPQICLVINHLARVSPSFCDRLRLLDSTPVPCGASRETVKRSDLAGWAGYGYCASHSRYFWGLRLYLLCAPDGMPIAFCLAPANEPEREVAAAMLERARRGELIQGGEFIFTDKGFSGQDFEQTGAALDAQLIRPDRRDEQPRFGALGGIRQWIESINDTLKGQFSLEQHGGHTTAGVWVRVCQRVLALAAGCWHNWLIDQPGRGFTAYDH